MKTIYKYPLHLANKTSIFTYAGAKSLHVAEQDGFLYLWAEVDIDKPMINHTILVRSTGQGFTGKEGYYLGTALMSDGLVWHVYSQEEIE